MSEKIVKKWGKSSRESRKRRGGKIYTTTHEPSDRCEICSTPYNDRPPNWDHDHKTGIFRGWICFKCNVTLGLAKDSITYLRKLIRYLQRTRRRSKKSRSIS